MAGQALLVGLVHAGLGCRVNLLLGDAPGSLVRLSGGLLRSAAAKAAPKAAVQASTTSLIAFFLIVYSPSRHARRPHNQR